MALLPLDHVASELTVEGRREDSTGGVHGPGLEAVDILVSRNFNHIPQATFPVREAWEHVFPGVHNAG